MSHLSPRPPLLEAVGGFRRCRVKSGAGAGEVPAPALDGAGDGRSVTAMSLIDRARVALSLHVTAARIGVRPCTLRMWTEVGGGPAPDAHGIYRRAVVTAWLQEMARAVGR